MSETWTIYTDGGSRGNPGPAAYAYVIKRPGHADIEEKCYLGQTTNNIAEYTGLVRALEHAKELGGQKLMIHSDSELMVKQMNGQYRVKNQGLLPLFAEADRLRKHFATVTIRHIRREFNTQADALCNEAMDHPRSAKPRTPCADAGKAMLDGKASAPIDATKCDAVMVMPVTVTPLQQALELLRESAIRWAESGDPSDPAPADVLHEICQVIQPDLNR